jgi:hypothetical protein
VFKDKNPLNHVANFVNHGHEEEKIIIEEYKKRENPGRIERHSILVGKESIALESGQSSGLREWPRYCLPSLQM